MTITEAQLSESIESALRAENAALRARIDRARMAVEIVIEAAEGTPYAAMLKVALAPLGASE